MASNLRMLALLALSAWAGYIASAFGSAASQSLPDSAQESRARSLFHDIRCVVCQGESIAESQAAIASDLRRVIRERIAAGESDDAIKDYLVSRYGEVILMQPPLKPSTLLLWFGPLLLLMAASAIAFAYFRTGRRT